MDITLYLSLTILVIFSLLGLLLLFPSRHRKRRPAAQIFSLLVFSVVFWLTANLMTDMSHEAFSAFFWSQFTVVWAAWIPSLFLYFTYFFPKKSKLSLAKKIFIFLPSLAIIFLAPTRLNIKSVKVSAETVPQVTTGSLYIFLLIFFLIFLILAFYRLYRNYRQVESRLQKLQISYVFSGALLSFLAGLSTNLIGPLVGMSTLARYSAFSTIFFVVATVYALSRHHLFEVKVITTEIFVVFLIVLLLWNVLESNSILALSFNFFFLLIAVVFSVSRSLQRFLNHFFRSCNCLCSFSASPL